MKGVLVFTLTLLFATTSLFIGTLTSEVDRDARDTWAGNAWGEAYVSTWFEFPFARATHWVSLFNYAPLAIRYYYDFYMEVEGPEDIFPLRNDGGGWVRSGGAWSTSKSHSVNMRNKRRGRYVIKAYSKLPIKADFNGNGQFDTFEKWEASCSTDFRIQ